jgi:tetratricopeptide (TPR) repeat protein
VVVRHKWVVKTMNQASRRGAPDCSRANFFVAFGALLFSSAVCFGQTPGPQPNLGGRLGEGFYVDPNYILNLDVQIQGPSGAPLKSLAVVTLYSQTGLPISTATTKSAKAMFTQLAPGSYYVEVEAPGYWKAREDAYVQPALTENTVSFKLAPAVTGSSQPIYSVAPLLDPEVQKQLHKGVDAIKSGNVLSAQKVLKFVVSKAPNHPVVLYTLGMLAQKKGDVSGAQTYWQRAFSIQPNYLLAVYALGQSYLQEENYAKAGEFGQKALELDPNSWQAHSLMASVSFRQEHYVDAVSHAGRALELGKVEASNISIVLAQALAVQGRRDEAIVALNQYLAVKPDDTHAQRAKILLSRLRSDVDHFVIEGTSGDKVPVDVAPPDASPVVEHWVPTNIDDYLPPVEPGASCDLDDVLSKAGAQLDRLPQTLDRFSATETIENEIVNVNGIASNSQKVSFAYVVSIRETRHGSLNVEEYRNGKDDDSAFPDRFATHGLPSQVFVFHPYYQVDFDMKCEGLARRSTGFAWQVRFEQKKNIPSRMQVHYLNGQRFPVPLKGRAWIDATNYQVTRLETDLREPVKGASLIAQHTEIEYGPVRFRKDNQELWLPVSADFYSQTHTHRIHRRHDFHDYMLFAIDDQQNIAKPKETHDP